MESNLFNSGKKQIKFGLGESGGNSCGPHALDFEPGSSLNIPLYPLISPYIPLNFLLSPCIPLISPYVPLYPLISPYIPPTSSRRLAPSPGIGEALGCRVDVLRCCSGGDLCLGDQRSFSTNKIQE